MTAAAMTQAETRRYHWAVLLRVLMATLGGYALTALACVVLAHALVALGAMQPAPAVLLSTLLSFVIYTVVALWVFHVRSLPRVAAWMAGSAAVMAVALQALKGLA
ncbi:hypothetical protein SR914_22465 [Comamonas testosteroni]|uniref:Iron transporter n=2 Tax=Comamonas testosteroni TaxID=285 RepID=B7WWN7_COMTK|nr:MULTISPECIES: hypothetical protein [Comamonas]EED67771.1 conserved hypothetical protein [Comamonas testosteroni KF-1]WQG65901.1 hypothetical protein SR914_22465 [Comamonas testosteroni]